MAGFVNLTPNIPTILGVNTAVNFKAGVPGTAGAANDCIVDTVIILKNAGPATLTFNSGFRDHTNTQDTTHYVLTGSTAQDTVYSLGLLNSAGPLQMTASAANAVIVLTRGSGL